MKRREFLGSALAGMTGAIVSGAVLHQEASAAKVAARPKGPISTDPTA